MDRQGHAGAGRWLGLALPAVALALVLGSLLGNPALRALLAAAWGRIAPMAVLAVLPVQLAAILVCTMAQQALRPGIPFRASFVARLVRDAAHNLLIFPPGLGEVVGARALVLLGGRVRMATALRVLDLTAEILAEVPYMMLAGWVLWHWWAGSGSAIARPALSHGRETAWGVVALLLLAGLAGIVWRRLRHTRLGRRLRAEAHLLGRELRRQRVGFPAAFLLHVIGWGLSGVQVWLAARVMGVPLDLWQALAIESAATSARVILFFVPGGLGMQEAAAVLAGLALGVPAPAALAFSLVLRLRDVAFGLALLGWPLLEWRARLRAAPASG
ncbi:MAG: flippase-like domain-containing protein [Proteobacteria bacterium]|nr:flippase-like domain-containing protein [Pseudomonadota bacterium]